MKSIILTKCQYFSKKNTPFGLKNGLERVLQKSVVCRMGFKIRIHADNMV
jgi:hypothetical protein